MDYDCFFNEDILFVELRLGFGRGISGINCELWF